jgi:hypothetical protein
MEISLPQKAPANEMLLLAGTGMACANEAARATSEMGED